MPLLIISDQNAIYWKEPSGELKFEDTQVVMMAGGEAGEESIPKNDLGQNRSEMLYPLQERSLGRQSRHRGAGSQLPFDQLENKWQF